MQDKPPQHAVAPENSGVFAAIIAAPSIAGVWEIFADALAGYGFVNLLALVVIPELRLSDLGLVDVRSFRKIPLLEPAS